MNNLLKKINMHINGTYMKLVWEKEDVVICGKIDTIYETNNGLDEANEDYIEFYACAFMVEDISTNRKNIRLKKGDLIEISDMNSPDIIYLNDGEIVWKKDYWNKGRKFS